MVDTDKLGTVKKLYPVLEAVHDLTWDPLLQKIVDERPTDTNTNLGSRLQKVCSIKFRIGTSHLEKKSESQIPHHESVFYDPYTGPHSNTTGLADYKFFCPPPLALRERRYSHGGDAYVRRCYSVAEHTQDDGPDTIYLSPLSLDRLNPYRHAPIQLPSQLPQSLVDLKNGDGYYNPVHAIVRELMRSVLMCESCPPDTEPQNCKCRRESTIGLQHSRGPVRMPKRAELTTTTVEDLYLPDPHAAPWT